MSVRPVPPGDPALPRLEVRVVGRGATAPEQPSEISFSGGGPIQTAEIERFHTAFGAEMRRVASPAGQDWWKAAGVALLEVEVGYGRERAAVRGRTTAGRLRVFVDVPETLLEGRAPRSLAREVAQQVVGVVRRRTGLGPHPEYPEP
jgi:hypothetical protein